MQDAARARMDANWTSIAKEAKKSRDLQGRVGGAKFERHKTISCFHDPLNQCYIVQSASDLVPVRVVWISRVFELVDLVLLRPMNRSGRCLPEVQALKCRDVGLVPSSRIPRDARSVPQIAMDLEVAIADYL